MLRAKILVFFLELLSTQTKAIKKRVVLLRFWSDERPRAAVAVGKIENHGLAFDRIPVICVLLHYVLYVDESIVPARGSEIAKVTAGISKVYRTADRHGNRYRTGIGGECASRKTESIQIRIIHIKDAGVVSSERDSRWNLAARIHDAG